MKKIKKIIKKTVVKKRKKILPEWRPDHLAIDNNIINSIKEIINNSIYKPTELISLKERSDNGEKISLIVSCMNRFDNLKKCIENWIGYNEVYEIILLDYGSTIPIEQSNIHKISDKIKLYRTETDHWHLTRAYNIAAQQVTGKIIMKMDADYIINNGFFENHCLKYNSFIFGGGGMGGLFGFACLYTNLFFLINGYNERLINYGHDDKDLFLRCQYVAGLDPIKIHKNYLYHIPHSWQQRIENQNIKEGLRVSCRKNVIRAKNDPWKPEDKMTPKDVAFRVY